MVKILILLCFFSSMFLSIYSQESKISNLITRFDNLPEAEKAAIVKKYPVFKKSLLDRFKNLSEAQKSVLIEKENIDLAKLETLIGNAETHLEKVEGDAKKESKPDGIKKPKKEFDKFKKSKKNELDEDELDELDKKTLLIIVKNLLKRDKEIQKLNKEIHEQKRKKVYSKLTSRSKPVKLIDLDQKNTKGSNSNLPGTKIKIKPKDKNEDDKVYDLLVKYEIEKEKKEIKLELFGQSLFKVMVSNNTEKEDSDSNQDEDSESSETVKKIGLIQTTVPTGIMPEDYILGPGDSLAIELFGSKTQKFLLKIKKDGNSSFPGIGPVFLNGVSFKDAKDKINRLVKTKMLNTKAMVTSGVIKNINIFVLGEVSQPGVITLSGLSSFIDALKMAGGITNIGSLRKIEIKRNNKSIGIFDLYPFLQTGDVSKFQTLRSGDVIVCPIIGPLVSVSGSVKRSAIYEILKSSSIESIINLAGGFSSDAMKKRVQIERILNDKKIIIDLDLTKKENLTFLIQDGDHIKIPSILEGLENGILLTGNVKRTQHYSYTKGTRISDLITSENIFKENTALHYALIQRQSGAGKEPTLISFNLGQALQGLENENKVLMPKDKIFIFHNDDLRESPTVKVEGLVINPGYYSWTKGMTVSNLILASGGVRLDAYLEKAEIYRWDYEKSKVIQINISLKDALNNKNKNKEDLLLNVQDRLVVHALSEVKIKHDVTIKGSVHNPEKYLYFDGMTVSDLIFAGGSLNEHANKHVASILRIQKNERQKTFTQYIQINLIEVFKGNKEFDIKLHPMDELTIFKSNHIKERYRVSVLGQVNNPGSYTWGKDMRISDLILEAGGIEDSAFVQKAEITHYKVIDGKERITEHEVIDLKLALKGDKKNNVILRPNDQLIVLKIPGWTEVNTVKLTGEIKYPGVYTIEKGEKLVDIIKRAGGLTPDAYLYAGFFSREKNRKIQRENLNKRADELERRVESLTATNPGNDDAFGEKIISIDSGKNLIKKIRTATVTGRIALDFEDAMLNIEGNNNIELIAGDEIKIPRKSQVIFVMGEVRNPTSFILDEKGKLKDYIQRAGGYSDFANKKGVYVIRANGSIIAKNSAGYKKRIFGKVRKSGSALRAGDTIVVPEKLNKFSGLRFTKDISQILFQIALTVAAFAGL